jgi:hypothetical protein
MGVLRTRNATISRNRDVQFCYIKNNNLITMTSRLSDTNTRNENGTQNAHVVNPGEGKIYY